MHPHPRSRHNVVRLFPQCSWMVRQVPHALPQWRSCRGYRGIILRLLRGCPCPGARDGASVQFYISTVIEDHRKICLNINFVVEMSDSGDLSTRKLAGHEIFDPTAAPVTRSRGRASRLKNPERFFSGLISRDSTDRRITGLSSLLRFFTPPAASLPPASSAVMAIAQCHDADNEGDDTSRNSRERGTKH